MAGGELDRDIMDTLGDLHRLRSEYKEAHHIQMQILQNASREQEPYHYVLAHYNIAQIDVEVGTSREDVVKNIETLMPVFKTTGILMGQIYGDMVRGALYLREKDWKTAKMLLQQCLRLVWGKHSHDASYCLERLGNFHAWGTMYRSSTWTMLFLVHSFKTKQKLDIHKAFQFLGDNYLADGDKDTAITLFTVALEGFIQMDVHRSQAECMLRLGDISKKDGDLERAVGLWKAARPLFERSSQTKQIALVEEKLASIPSEHIEEYD
jgi:tetratricopeptide (TPR) repeat protein